MLGQKTDTDLLIIGAGIQGAGVAQAASANGYRVTVLEQYAEPAQGTSSRSSKLIHGGLRYLETGQYSLVRECLQERALLLRNAPDLVHLNAFYIPIYENSHYSSWKIAAGLSLYSLFSCKPFKRIPRDQWSTLKGLKQKGLKNVFEYYDAQTDDAALTRAVLASAESLHAKIHYQAHFETAEIDNAQCITHYTHNGQRKTITSSAIVNAAGPWAKRITDKIPYCENQPDFDLVAGTHIEVPNLNNPGGKQGVYYLEAVDKRVVFIMPWKNNLLIGTTETIYTGDPADIKPLESEIDYLLEVYNHYLETQLARPQIINAFAGLRVLPKATGSAFSRPRDTLIVGNTQQNPRLFTLYGGKLTAYRATAENVMQQIRPELPGLPANTQKIDTKTLKLTPLITTQLPL